MGRQTTASPVQHQESLGNGTHWTATRSTAYRMSDACSTETCLAAVPFIVAFTSGEVKRLHRQPDAWVGETLVETRASCSNCGNIHRKHSAGSMTTEDPARWPADPPSGSSGSTYVVQGRTRSVDLCVSLDSLSMLTELHSDVAWIAAIV